jgi:hypothetical protein
MSFQNGVWAINDWTISEFWCISKPKTNLMKTQRGALLNTQIMRPKSKNLNLYRK